MHKRRKRKPVKQKTLYEGKYKRLVSKGDWEFVERVNCCGIVAVLPVTDEGKIIFVEQHRIPVGKNVIEFPAGLADGAGGNSDESLEEAAKRELLEETGYSAEKMILCGEGPISGSSSSDIMTIFRAAGLKKVAAGGGDHTESIVVHEIDFVNVDDWLDQKQKEGILVDSKVYAGLYILSKNR